jgi:acyl carrier protein
MSNRLYEVFANVLKVPAESLTDRTSPENTPRWDSLASMNLVLALEEEFGVRLGTKDIAEMKNLKIVKAVLARKGATDL